MTFAEQRTPDYSRYYDEVINLGQIIKADPTSFCAELFLILSIIEHIAHQTEVLGSESYTVLCLSILRFKIAVR